VRSKNRERMARAFEDVRGGREGENYGDWGGFFFEGPIFA
jgi:hypothetical protein